MTGKPRGRYHKDGELRHRLLFARNVGWGRGYAGRHDEPRNFETGAEWLAWLAGWREGYAFRAEELRAEADAVQRRDRIMQRILTEQGSGL